MGNDDCKYTLVGFKMDVIDNRDDVEAYEKITHAPVLQLRVDIPKVFALCPAISKDIDVYGQFTEEEQNKIWNIILGAVKRIEEQHNIKIKKTGIRQN